MNKLTLNTLSFSPDYVIKTAIRYTVIDAGPLNSQTDLNGWWYRLIKGLLAIFPHYFEAGKLKPIFDSNFEINHITIEVITQCLSLSSSFEEDEIEEIKKGLIKRRISFKWIHKYIATLFPGNPRDPERLFKELQCVGTESYSKAILPKLMNICDSVFDHYGGFKSMDPTTKQEVLATIYKSLTLNESCKWLADLAYECYTDRKHIAEFYKAVQIRLYKTE